MILQRLDFFCTNVHQIWAFGMDSGGSTSTVNCIASISVWFRRKEWGMRVIKKNIGQAKERGGGEEERKNTPCPPPPSFFGSSSIFCATETKNPIPRLSLVFLHSHMEMLATQATTTAMNLPTAFDSEFLLIMDSQDGL